MAQKAEYYLINEALVSPEVSEKHHEILHENIISAPNGNKLMTITFKQVLQDFGVRNWNGRIYSKDLVMNAITNNPLIQHDLKMAGGVAQEYGHPLIEKGMNELARQMTIFPPNCCSTWCNYRTEGNLLIGEVTTLAGGYGDMLMNRVLTGHPAQASSRAIGGVDKNGNVLAGYSLITFDMVERPSHKSAFMDRSSVTPNFFNIPGSSNTMSESAVKYDFTQDPSFTDFLMTESSSRQQIEMLCETFAIDPASITVDKKSVKLKRLDENGIQTVIIPLRKLVDAAYYNLF